MELQTDYCHWCEAEITRTQGELKLAWLDADDSATCMFHPANWNPSTLKSTDESAPHQTIEEVHAIVKAEYYRQQALRRKQPLRSVNDNVVAIAKNAQRTSRKAAEKLEPNAGTMRAEIWLAIKNNNGLTDYELETLLRGKHQTVSASRRSLVIDGWIVDSGMTRKNAQGNECIVWVVNRSATQGVLL